MVECIECGKKHPGPLRHDEGWKYLYDEPSGTNIVTGQPATVRDCLDARTPVEGGMVSRYMCPECVAKKRKA